MYLYEISQVFKPTVARLNVSQNNLDRNSLRRLGTWTTNGEWLMLSLFEPIFLQKVRSNADEKLPLKNITDLVKKNSKPKYQMELVNELKIQNNPIVKLEGPTHETWVNAYYIAMVDKMATISAATFHQTAPLDPVVIKSADNIIGLIMPVKLAN